MEKLLIEVKALAMRLRQIAGAGADVDGVPSTGRQLLRSLQQEGPQSVPQLARRRCTSRQNIQVLINRLVQDGCVAMSSNPAHKRSALAHLTERGQRVLLAASVHEQGVTAALGTHFSQQGIQSAVELLQQVRLHLGISRASPRQAAHRANSKPTVPAAAQPADAQPEPTDGLPVSLL